MTPVTGGLLASPSACSMRQQLLTPSAIWGSKQFMRRYAVGRVYTMVQAVTVLLVGAGGMLLSTTA